MVRTANAAADPVPAAPVPTSPVSPPRSVQPAPAALAAPRPVRSATRWRLRVMVAFSAVAVLVAALALVVPWLSADPPSRRNAIGHSASTGVAGLPPPLVPSGLASPAVSGINPSTASTAATTRAPGGDRAGGASAPAFGTPAASDDFTGSALDSATWGLYESTASNGSTWTPDMVHLAGGELQILGVGRNTSGAGNTSGGACWGCHGVAHTYGVWQFRARFDAGAGYSPVIGLGPAQGDMDTVGWITLLNMPQAARTSATYLVRGPGSTAVTGSTSADFTAWHTYTVEWRATVVRMYRDNVLVLDTTGKSVAIPSVPMYLFIQQEVGPTGSIPAPNSGTPGKVVMHFDWVRYYG